MIWWWMGGFTRYWNEDMTETASRKGDNDICGRSVVVICPFTLLSLNRYCRRSESCFSDRIILLMIDRVFFPSPQESRVWWFVEWALTAFHSIVMMREWYRGVDESECTWETRKSYRFSEDGTVKMCQRMEDDLCYRYLELDLWEGFWDRRESVVSECELMRMVHGNLMGWNGFAWSVLLFEPEVGLIWASVLMWLRFFIAVLTTYWMCNKQGM